MNEPTTERPVDWIEAVVHVAPPTMFAMALAWIAPEVNQVLMGPGPTGPGAELGLILASAGGWIAVFIFALTGLAFSVLVFRWLLQRAGR